MHHACTSLHVSASVHYICLILIGLSICFTKLFVGAKVSHTFRSGPMDILFLLLPISPSWYHRFLSLTVRLKWLKQKPLYHSGKFWCQARFWTWQPPHSAGTHKWEMLHKSPWKYKRHRSWCLGHYILSCWLAALAQSWNDCAAALTSVAAVLLL